jgi:hypothetical protein
MKHMKIFLYLILAIIVLCFCIFYTHSLFKTKEVANCTTDVFPSAEGKNTLCHCGNGYSLWCKDGELYCVKDGKQVYGRYCDAAGILLPESNWENSQCCD